MKQRTKFLKNNPFFKSGKILIHDIGFYFKVSNLFVLISKSKLN